MWWLVGIMLLVGLGWFNRCCIIESVCSYVTTTDCYDQAATGLDVNWYEFTMAGMSNGTCSDCAEWNGTFTLAYDTSDTWHTPDAVSSNCSKTGGDPYYTLTRTGGYYVLTANGVGATWKLATTSWLCSQKNTLTLDTSSGSCASYPATVELTPCMGICQHCVDTELPQYMVVDLPAAENSTGLAPCTDCASLAGAYLVEFKEHTSYPSATGICRYEGVYTNPTTCAIPGFGTADTILIRVDIMWSSTNLYEIRAGVFTWDRSDGSAIAGPIWRKTGVASKFDCMNLSNYELDEAYTSYLCKSTNTSAFASAA